MRKKAVHDRKIQILAVFVIFLQLFAAGFWYGQKYNVFAKESLGASLLPAVTAALPGAVGEPARLKIPSIGVDAAIEHVALTPKGLMGVPKDPMNTAWYELGPNPGEIGSAVIDGHVDWWYGATGVFANLDELKPGDTLSVEDNAGGSISFVVREIRIYDAQADATDIFLSNDGKAHLNLITCEGAWNRNSQSYSERLVVFTDRK